MTPGKWNQKLMQPSTSPAFPTRDGQWHVFVQYGAQHVFVQHGAQHVFVQHGTRRARFDAERGMARHGTTHTWVGQGLEF